MAYPQGLVFYPGVTQFEKFSGTLFSGITPSSFMLEIQPQDPSSIPIDGTLLIAYGATTIEFFNCRVDRASFEFNESGLLWRFAILDRRWKWKFGSISETWNEYRVDVGTIGEIDPSSVRAPQLLAGDCLTAMGEAVFDVSSMPNNILPEVRWDHDNPAQMLQDLCEQCGCLVTLGLDNIVRICVKGVGAALPTDAIEQASEVIDFPEIPDTITVVGGPSQYQVDFLLEAVGPDVDGVWKPIDDLSYRPKNGWTLADFAGGKFFSVPGWSPTPGVNRNLYNAQVLGYVNPRQLASDNIFRAYRIKMQGIDDPTKTPLIPGWSGGRIKYLWQILPLLDHQAQGWYDPAGIFHYLPAWTFGVFFGRNQDFVNTQPNSFCYFDFEILAELGIIRFSDTVTKYTGNPASPCGPADLILRVAVNVKDPTTAAVDRYEFTEATGSESGTGTKIIKREEIIRWCIPTYTPGIRIVNGLKVETVTSVLTSDSYNSQEAAYAIAASLYEYQLKDPLDAQYTGIRAIQLDGAIQQVTWDISAEGCLTRASRNTEYHPSIPTNRQRLLIQQLRTMPGQLKALIYQSRPGGGR